MSQYKLVRFNLNGKDVEKMVDVRASLTDMLRNDYHMTSVKKGCEVGECGACNVIIDGECFNSCIYLAVWADGKHIRTLESLMGPDGELSDIQQAFIEETAVQCGFCTPGFILTATEILAAGKEYSDDELRKLLSGHLCRCTGYQNIFRAVNSTLIYLERGDEYLMLHRTKKENDLNHDKWIGVGGKFEDGESPEDCALRETREETGLTLTRWRYRGLVTFVSDRYETEYMHLFTADGWTGTPKECDEGELAWIKKSELLKLRLWEGDKIFLRLLDTDEPFFSLKLKYEGDTLVLAQLNGAPLEVGR